MRIPGILLALSIALAGCKGGAKTEAGHDEKGHDEKGHDEKKGSGSGSGAKGHDEKDEKGHDEKAHDEHDEKGHEKGKVVHLTPEQVKAANIQTAKVEIRNETAVLEANGQIAPADSRQARVGVRVPGRVTALKAGIGDVVKKGQVLAIVESPELGRAKADYVSAASAAKLARDNAAREKLLFEKKISAEVEWRKAESEAVRTASELQAAEGRLHALGVGDGGLPGKVAHFSSSLGATSPINGVVVDRTVTLGEMVDPEKTLFHVMDLSEVWLLVDVFERDVAQVTSGQKVSVSVTAYPQDRFEGKVDHVGAIVDPKSRAVKVRIVLANPTGRLKPGMFARISLSDTKGDDHQHLFVPVEAVQRTEEGTIVFLPGDEAGEFVPRAVKTGHEAGKSVAIESGLSAGEVVVISGSFILKSELGKESLGESGHSH